MLTPLCILVAKLYHYLRHGHDHLDRYALMNELIFVLFSFKLLSLFLLFFLVCVVITDAATLPTALTLSFSLFAAGTVVALWTLIGSISTMLYALYQERFALDLASSTTYVRPLVPLAKIKGYELSPLSSAQRTGVKSCFASVVRLWARHTFWFRHGLLFVTCLLTIVTAAIKFKLEKDENIARYAVTTIIAAVLPIALSLYSVLTEYNSARCGCKRLSLCVSSDVKYRGIIFTKTLLFMLKNYLIEFSGPDLLGACVLICDLGMPLKTLSL